MKRFAILHIPSNTLLHIHEHKAYNRHEDYHYTERELIIPHHKPTQLYTNIYLVKNHAKLYQILKKKEPHSSPSISAKIDLINLKVVEIQFNIKIL